MRIRATTEWRIPHFNFDMDAFTKEMLGHLPMDKIEEFHKKGECLIGMKTAHGHEVITKYRIVEDDRPVAKVTDLKATAQKLIKGKTDGSS